MDNNYQFGLVVSWVLFFGIGVFGGAMITEEKTIPLYELYDNNVTNWGNAKYQKHINQQKVKIYAETLKEQK